MNAKIRHTHLERLAVVYLRQSTVKQVIENRESTARQYQLQHRALELGWTETFVRVIDEDLGASGTTVLGRPGFQNLAEDVAHRRVGLILALDASRLARCSADWHRLLELCKLADVLIADETAVFDPRDPNDKLVLGLRGELSDAELDWMRLRLQGARLSKAARGELRLHAPVGYEWDSDLLRLRMTADERVRNAVSLIFERFRIEGSARGVARYFANHGLEIPHLDCAAGEIRWLPPRACPIRNMLHNPIYAGAYAYGRREERKALVNGEIRRRHTRWLPTEQWKVCLKERHPGYLTWEDYMANREKLDQNSTHRADPRRKGAAREGMALLQGLAICGKCGYRFHVRYANREFPQYYCGAPGRQSGAGGNCWTVPAHTVDNSVVEQILAVVQPEEVELSLALLNETQHQMDELQKQWRTRIEQAGYEARLAERRYKAVDPDNRTVARRLEQEWDEKLRDLERVQQEYEEARRRKKLELTDTERQQVLRIGQTLHELWGAESTSNAQRKTIARLLIHEVCLTPVDEPSRMTRVAILWQTGAVQELLVPRPYRWECMKTPTAVAEKIRALVEQGYTSDAVAEALNREGLRTAKGQPWDREAVWIIRRRFKLRSPAPADTPPRAVINGKYTTRGLAQLYGMTAPMIHYWVKKGWLAPTETDSGGGRWRFELDDQMKQDIERIIEHGHGPRGRKALDE